MKKYAFLCSLTALMLLLTGCHSESSQSDSQIISTETSTIERYIIQEKIGEIAIDGIRTRFPFDFSDLPEEFVTEPALPGIDRNDDGTLRVTVPFALNNSSSDNYFYCIYPQDGQYQDGKITGLISYDLPITVFGNEICVGDSLDSETVRKLGEHYNGTDTLRVYSYLDGKVCLLLDGQMIKGVLVTID